MQLQRGQKVRLGLFFLASVGLLAVSLAVLLGLKWLTPSHTFRARFNESIAGLERNAPVRYQGLRVGRVETLYVAPDDPTLIEVVMTLDPGTPLYGGTTVQLDLSGLTGIKSINLKPGDVRAGRLPPGSMLPALPSMMGRLADNATAILDDVRHVAEQLGAFANPNNRRQIEHLVAGLDRVVGHVDTFLEGEQSVLHGTLQEAKAMTHAVRGAADETALTLRQAREVLGVMQGEAQLTLAAVRRSLDGVEGAEIKATLQAVHGAASELQARLGQAEAGASIAAFHNTMGRVDHLVRDVDLAVRAGREDFAKSLSYLRQAAEDFREFSRILASNPSVLVRGRGEEP